MYIYTYIYIYLLPAISSAVGRKINFVSVFSNFDLARQLVFPTSFQIVKTIVKDAFFFKLGSHIPKQFRFLLHSKPFKNDKKCFFISY